MAQGERNVTTVAVIGAGTMGAGIAQVAAQHGHEVHLIDVSPSILERGLADIHQRLDRLVEKGRLTASEGQGAKDRLHPSTVIADLRDVTFAIEAAVERLDVKRDVFQALEKTTASEAVLATNTSSLTVRRIAQSLRDPSRVIGMHFFNPAPLMPLVEVIRTAWSRLDMIDRAMELARRWDKVPVRAKDTPGFIVNRVARGFYLEALRLLGEGVAGVERIDRVMREAGAFRMGPFQLMDLVGLDVNYAVSQSVWEQMNRHPRFTPHSIQRTLVEQGKLGQKTGQGFYSHEEDPPRPVYQVNVKELTLPHDVETTLRAFARGAGVADHDRTDQYIFARILGAVLNEAGWAFDEDVASADDIDTAMRKGTNYPKGPMTWAREIGHDQVARTLDALNRLAGDDRYAGARTFTS